jgi:hypothetical protein
MRAILLSLCAAAATFVSLQDEEQPKAPSLPEVGKPAPTFRLNAHDGHAVKIGPGENWTVLAFFPKAATPG